MPQVEATKGQSPERRTCLQWVIKKDVNVTFMVETLHTYESKKLCLWPTQLL